MEMKDIYPKLPTAPPIEDQGQGYRLQKINEIQTFLEKEVETREALSKKYFRAAKIVNNVDTVLITITIVLRTKSVTKKEMNKCMAEIYDPGGIRTRAARFISQYHNH